MLLASSYTVTNISNLFSKKDYLPYNAFVDNDALWGGRKSQGIFEIGGSAQIPSEGEIMVQVNQRGGHVVDETTQDKLKEEGNGVKFMVERNGNWDELCTLEINVAVGLINAMSCTANLGMKFKIVTTMTATNYWDVQLITLTVDRKTLNVTDSFDSAHSAPSPNGFIFMLFRFVNQRNEKY